MANYLVIAIDLSTNKEKRFIIEANSGYSAVCLSEKMNKGTMAKQAIRITEANAEHLKDAIAFAQ